MNYDFKPAGEALRAVAIAVCAETAQVLKQTDPATVTDWKSWAMSLGVACAIVALAAFAGAITSPPAPPSPIIYPYPPGSSGSPPSSPTT